MSSQFKKNIKIILEYNNRTVASFMKPYDKMIEIRKLAFKVFYPLKKDISLTYQNQDLSEFDSYLIGEYFNEKTLAKIKVVPKIIKRELRITDKSIEGNDPKKKYYHVYVENIIYQIIVELVNNIFVIIVNRKKNMNHIKLFQ